MPASPGAAWDRAAALGDPAAARRALAAWRGRIGVGLPLHPVPAGLINATWRVGAPARFALQLVHPRFGDAANARLAAMAPPLAAAGVRVPPLLATDEGRLGLPGPGGGGWRLTGWLPGRSGDAVASPAHAHAAAALLAAFHDALAEAALPDWPASDFHDTEAHMKRLAAALPADRDAPTLRLGEAILAAWAAWRDAAPALPTLPRPGHGDPKISNFLFAPGSATALGLLDLDTAARFPLEDDLGDGLRSWCNPNGEDDPDGPLDEAVFAAAVAGYLGRARQVAADERRRIVWGTVRIALELAARFCLDAVEQRYFAWNPALAPSRRAHNLLRAGGQLRLAERLIARRGPLERLVAGV